jgi:hypothetical protein
MNVHPENEFFLMAKLFLLSLNHDNFDCKKLAKDLIKKDSKYINCAYINLAIASKHLDLNSDAIAKYKKVTENISNHK